jgi:polyferredoxin
MSNLKLLLFIAALVFIMYHLFLKTNSWFDQLIDLISRTKIGKAILWVIGIVLVILLILMKAAI